MTEYNQHFQDENGKFSATKFWDYMELEADRVMCDETHPNFWRRDEETPEFYDALKFKRGQAFFEEYKASMLGASLLGLMAILYDPVGTKILHNTGKSSDPYSAYKRYIDTLRHVLTWYSSDFTPGSELWKSVLKIKHMHNAASNNAVNNGLYRINHRWMSETLFGFMGLALTRPHRFGLGNATHEELSGLVHFWRVIGWMMGIEDRFNICRDSLEETRTVCNMFMDKYLRRWIYVRDPNCYNLQMSLIKGMASVIPSINIHLTFNSVLDLIEPPCEENKHLYFRVKKIEQTISDMFRILLKELEITEFRRFANVFTEYLIQGLMDDELTDRIFSGKTPCIMFS